MRSTGPPSRPTASWAFTWWPTAAACATGGGRGRGLACMLRGGEEVLEQVCQRLGVKPGGTSADGKVTVEFAECIGVCEGAPAVLVNDEGRGNVTLEKVDVLLDGLCG